jgi:outer membrane protein assembly factor BamB
VNRFLAFVVLAVLLAPTVAVRAQDAATPVATATAGEDADWSEFRGNPARTGVTSATGPVDQPGIRWRLETGAGWRHSPVVVGGIVYTATEANLLLANDAASGAEIWRVALLPTFGHPAVGAGLVVVGSTDGLYAFDAATGQQRWLFQPDGQPRDIDASTLIVDGVV